MYKKMSSTCVKRLVDGAIIQLPANESEGWRYEEWLLAGNVPEPLGDPLVPTREQLSSVARDYLASTDWYIIRRNETGADIPTVILEARQAARHSVVAA